jgi:PAS domain S-box-containing protein
VPELTTIPVAELAELRERLNRLARDKAQLQLVALLMNRLGELPGLEKTVLGMLQFVTEILGGSNATVVYRLDDALHLVDVHGRREVVTEVEDELVRRAFETREFVSRERDFSQTGMLTREFAKATTWAMPLLVGPELVGVLRVDDLTVAGGELQDEVQTFLRYASLVLKNEISGEARLRRAFDEVSRANRELQRAKDELEGRVAERTSELRASNERLRLELGERARAEAALAARHSTLRGIIEGSDAPIFSLDAEYRYVAFNCSHAAVMRALYGVEIEPGRNMLDCMTVGEDRERARANLDRALAGEHLLELAYSGEEQRTRTCFEVSHHPIRAEDGRVIGVAVFASDVTERQRAEDERHTSLWVSESLDRVNRAIQGTQDLEQMMSDVLDAALAIFECDRAFLLHPCDPDAASYRVPMERTRPGFPGALARGLEVPVDPESARVLRAARTSPGPLAFDPGSEPPLPTVLRETFHVQSQIAMALYPRLGEPYMFGLHQCAQPRTWRPEEQRLFQEIGRRLADALTSLLARRELRESEDRYRRITESLTDYLYSVRVENGRAVATTQSPACAVVTGYTDDDCAGDPLLWLRLVAPEDRELVQERVRHVLAGTEVPPLEHRIVRKDGVVRWVRDTTVLLRDASGRLLSYDGVVEDITERKLAELELARVNRALRMLSDSNQALIHASDEASLLAEVCRIAAEVGGYRTARVQLAGDPAAQERRADPGGRAIREGQTCIARGIPIDAAVPTGERRHGSSIALPLIREGQTLGALSIASDEADAFDGNEVAILEELASDLAFGLNALRTRAERERAEAALQVSERKYRTLIQKIRAGVVVHAADTRIITCNPMAQDLLGLTEDQLLGKAAIDPAWHFFRADRTAMPPAEYPVSQVLASGDPLRNFVMGAHRPARDDDVWVLVNADPVVDERGALSQVIVTFIDISVRKRAEEALQRREAELHESQRVAHVGSWDWDAVKDSVWWSPEFARIYGIAPAESQPTYRQRLEAYTAESAGRLDALVQRALRTGEPYEVDLELADPRACARWVVARGEVKRDAQGRIRGLRGTTQDITERKRLELEMRRAAAAIEQAAEVIMITDPDAVIQYVNPAFTRVTGFTPEQAVGQRASILKSGRHDQDFYRALWATLRRGETWRGHLVNRRRDGTEFEEDATISPVRDESGRVAHYVAVKRDVTQEVALEAQLRQAQKMEAIGRLAGGIAHDFNNLLQALLSHAQLLRISPERVDTELPELEAQIRRGAALTRQLLLFSRRQEAHREPLDLNEVIASLGQLLRRLVRENVTLAIELNPGPLMIDADRGQLDQVLMNLTINATDAMPGGGRLSIRTGRQGAMACLAVEDTGSGIPESIRSKIFEPLFTTKPVGLGTGLGLSLVRDIVSEHGGRIELESAEGAGTTFRVLLPEAISAGPSRSAPSAREEAWPPGHGERVLVVEDGAAARVGLRAILRSLRYEVTAVGSGREARALMGEAGFDALLSDVMLPDVEGTALVRELLDRWPGMGVILMSGYSEADVLARVADLPRVHFLQKPFDANALAKALRQTLSGQ